MEFHDLSMLVAGGIVFVLTLGGGIFYNGPAETEPLYDIDFLIDDLPHPGSFTDRQINDGEVQSHSFEVTTTNVTQIWFTVRWEDTGSATGGSDDDRFTITVRYLGDSEVTFDPAATDGPSPATLSVRALVDGKPGDLTSVPGMKEFVSNEGQGTWEVDVELEANGGIPPLDDDDEEYELTVTIHRYYGEYTLSSVQVAEPT